MKSWLASAGARLAFSVDPLLAMAAGTMAVLLAGYLATIHWGGAIPTDGTGMVVGRDFLNFWMYGRAALAPDPGQYYDLDVYARALAALLGANSGQNWSYPPSVMLIAAPFGVLPYLTALALFTALSVSVFALAGRKTLGGGHAMLLALSSPAAAFCLLSGQNALLTCAIILLIFRNLDARPRLAGVLIACLCVKPQLALMFPVILAASGRWRVVAAAGGGVLAIVLATAWLFGPMAWAQFFTLGVPTQTLVLKDPAMLGAPFMPTIFMNARQLGLTYEQAMAMQAAFSLAAVAMLAWAFHARREGDKDVLFALFCACSVCGSPYVLSYDLLPLTCAIVVLMRRPTRSPAQKPPWAYLLFSAYWLTSLQLAFGAAHVPGPALLAFAFAATLAWSLREGAGGTVAAHSVAAA